MSRFILTGDLHVGAGVGQELNEYDLTRLADQQQAWHRCLDLAEEHNVDGILFAGDAFERRKPTPAESLAFVEPIAKHRPHARILAILGNHDRAGTKAATEMGVFAVAGLLSLHARPDWTYFDGCYVASLPWAPTSWLVAEYGGGDRDVTNQAAAELLMRVAADLHADIEAQRENDWPIVLMLHWSMEEGLLPSGLPVGTLREPMLSAAALEEIGFDYVIGGHIHKAGLITPTGRSLYVGSPLPLSHGEAGPEHGCWLLDTEQGLTFLPIASRRFVTIEYEPDTLLAAGVSKAFRDGAIVRVRYTATAAEARDIDQRALSQALLDAGAFHVTVEPTIVREQRARAHGLDEQVDETEAFRMWADANGVEFTDQLAARHDGYVTAVAA